MAYKNFGTQANRAGGGEMVARLGFSSVSSEEVGVFLLWIFHLCERRKDNGRVLALYWRDRACSVGPLLVWRRGCWGAGEGQNQRKVSFQSWSLGGKSIFLVLINLLYLI